MEFRKGPGGLEPGGIMWTGIRLELKDDSSRIAGISFTRFLDLLILIHWPGTAMRRTLLNLLGRGEKQKRFFFFFLIIIITTWYEFLLF